MPGTVSHQLSATTPDDPLYEIRPSHWNDTHAVTFNMVGSEISGAFGNGGGVTFGLSADGKVTASAPAAGGGLTNINVSAGTTSNNLSAITFANSNGITFGLDASTLTASHNGLTQQSTQPVAASAANGSFAFSTLSFSNVNGVSFGTSAGSAITASHNGLTSQSNQAFSAGGGSSTFQTLSFRNANGLSFSNSNGSVEASYTVPTVPAQLSVGNSNLGNTQGDTGVVTGRLVLVGTNNITLSGSTNAGSMTISISGGAGAAGNTGYLSAGTTFASLGTVSFANSNGVSFGVDGQTITATVKTDYLTTAAVSDHSHGVTAGNGGFNFRTLSFSNANGISFGTSAGSAITASYTVPTVTNSSWTVSDAATSISVARLAFTNANGLTLSLSTTTGGSATVVGSYTVPTVPAQLSVGNSNLGNTLGDTGVVTGRLVLVGTNNITLSGSTNGGSMTISISGGAGGAGNTGSISAGTTRGTLGEVVFSNSNGVSFGMDGQTVTASHNGLTSQSNQNVTAGNGGFDFQTLSFSNANGFSFGTSAGSAITGSYTVPAAQTGISGIEVSNTTYTSGTVTFRNANGISFGSSGANGISASYTVPTQTNQSLGIYASSQTTGQSSSSTYDARSLTIVGDGIVSLGWSNGSFRISATQSNQAFSADASSTFQTLSFQNSNGISFSNNAGAIRVTHDLAGTSTGFAGANISGSMTHNSAGLNLSLSVAAPGAAAENNWHHALGANTAGNTTASGSTIGLSGVNLTISGTNGSVFNLSAPATSSLVGTSGMSISTNGSTISVQPVPLSEWVRAHGITAAGSAIAQSSMSLVPFSLGWPLAASQIELAASLSRATQTNSSSAGFSLGMSAVLYSRNGATLTSFASGSFTSSTFHQSNSTSSIANARKFTISLNAAQTLTPGQYWLGLHVSTTTAGETSLALGFSMGVVPTWASGFGAANYLGSNTTNTRPISPGQAIHSTGATRASIAFSDITGHAGNSASLANLWFGLRNQTVW